MSGQERYLSMTSFHLIHFPVSSVLQLFYPPFYSFCIHFPCIPLNHFSVPFWLLHVTQRWLMETPVDSSPIYSTSHILLFVCLSTILVTRHFLLDFTNVAFLASDFQSWTCSPSVASVPFLSLIFHALLTKKNPPLRQFSRMHPSTFLLLPWKLNWPLLTLTMSCWPSSPASGTPTLAEAKGQSL